MHDQLKDGGIIKLFNATDNLSRQALGIEVDFSLPSLRVIRILDQIISWLGRPCVIRADKDW